MLCCYRPYTRCSVSRRPVVAAREEGQHGRHEDAADHEGVDHDAEDKDEASRKLVCVYIYIYMYRESILHSILHSIYIYVYIHMI